MLSLLACPVQLSRSWCLVQSWPELLIRSLPPSTPPLFAHSPPPQSADDQLVGATRAAGVGAGDRPAPRRAAAGRRAGRDMDPARLHFRQEQPTALGRHGVSALLGAGGGAHGSFCIALKAHGRAALRASSLADMCHCRCHCRWCAARAGCSSSAGCWASRWWCAASWGGWTGGRRTWPGSPRTCERQGGIKCVRVCVCRVFVEWVGVGWGRSDMLLCLCYCQAGAGAESPRWPSNAGPVPLALPAQLPQLVGGASRAPGRPSARCSLGIAGGACLAARFGSVPPSSPCPPGRCIPPAPFIRAKNPPSPTPTLFPHHTHTHHPQANGGQGAQPAGAQLHLRVPAGADLGGRLLRGVQALQRRAGGRGR